MKEWGCCKQRSHDFSLFLAIPGCKTGTHTIEKLFAKTKPTQPRAVPVSYSTPGTKPTDSKQEVTSCSRCRQGFFCSDHGSQAQPPKPEKVNPPRRIDLNESKTCRNKGCGKPFKEKDNHEAACEYHPGPPVFHDRKRGWKCCDVLVNEFEEFMAIPPCAKGWHNAEAA
ncbi:cysteine and histidine-rich domain-containing protein RAR1 [Wolffia australiana]